MIGLVVAMEVKIGMMCDLHATTQFTIGIEIPGTNNPQHRHP